MNSVHWPLLCPRHLKDVPEGGTLVPRQLREPQHRGNRRKEWKLSKEVVKGRRGGGEGVGEWGRYSPVLEPVRPGLSSKVFGSCLEPWLPWGQCQPQPTVTSGITFQKLVSERDELGPRGLYLCVLVLGRRRKEKRKGWGSWGGRLQKQLVGNGKLLCVGLP